MWSVWVDYWQVACSSLYNQPYIKSCNNYLMSVTRNFSVKNHLTPIVVWLSPPRLHSRLLHLLSNAHVIVSIINSICKASCLTKTLAHHNRSNCVFPWVEPGSLKYTSKLVVSVQSGSFNVQIRWVCVILYQFHDHKSRNIWYQKALGLSSGSPLSLQQQPVSSS